MSITSATVKTDEKVSRVVRSEPKVENLNVLNVRQLVRWISRQNITNLTEGYDRVEDVNAELNALYQQGYKLFATHYLGQVPEAYGVLYILTLS